MQGQITPTFLVYPGQQWYWGNSGCKVSQGVSITKAEVQWGSLVWIWWCSVAQKGNVQVYKQQRNLEDLADAFGAL